ncbi:MAG: DUF5132 domain-containing protein [Desulfosarcina sp.]
MKLLNGGMSIGSLAMGAGVVLLAPVIIPVVGSVLKPVAKAVIKGGLLAYEGAKVSIAETKETLEDLAAEAKSEMSEDKEAA